MKLSHGNTLTPEWDYEQNKKRDKRAFFSEVEKICKERNKNAARTLGVLASHSRPVTDLLYDIIRGGIPHDSIV